MDEVLERIGEIGIVPVIKLENAEKAVPLGRALALGGIPVAEVTFRTKAAPDAIRAMAEELPGLLVGAGTVTSVAMAEAAAAAGARFIVCPGWDEAVVDWCLAKAMPVLPGVSGPDGVMRGMAKGLDTLKFFPAEAVGGLPMLDALSGPFPSVKFVPTGGIDASNVGAYARKGYIRAVGGSWMVKADLVEAGAWAEIERLCREAVFALHGFQLAHVGVNGASAEEATREAASLASLFGFAPKEGASSFVAPEGIEVTKAPYLGAHGHLAIRCNDVERAVARFRDMGIGIVAGTEKTEKGRLKTVYLEREIGGFALHLLRA